MSVVVIVAVAVGIIVYFAIKRRNVKEDIGEISQNTGPSLPAAEEKREEEKPKETAAPHTGHTTVWITDKPKKAEENINRFVDEFAPNNESLQNYNAHRVGRLSFFDNGINTCDYLFDTACGAVTIGRGSECNICVNSAEVSRIQCRLLKSDNVWLLMDAGSSNGTYFGGERIPSGIFKEIKEKDSFSIGTKGKNFLLTFEDAID